MDPSALPDSLGPELSSALAQKGYTALTPVQTAVLDPALAGRDLRITSQTGSGKTVAIGLALRDFVREGSDREGDSNGGAVRGPRALVVAPTRELAKQVEEELSWLYAPLGVRVVSVTGGASYRDERRALSGAAAKGPGVVVGTPGRLLDHLQRSSFDAGNLGAVVLDEADRLLDLGFRDDLEAILAFAPKGHRTHLVSATFPREVKALADATQHDPVHVEGTRLGAANADIDHIVHLVDARERVGALINILLANPDEQTLVFARTRADVASIARELKDCGFAVSSLSGEMDQSARNRALSGFKRGDLRVLVATDVAARGIDVQDIARVVHAEPPSDADSYTHRSGRTGRAGRKGTSAILAIAAQLARTTFLLQRAGVAFRFEPIPSAEVIRGAADERTAAALLADDTAEASGLDERTWALAKRIVAEGDVTRALARLLTRTRYAGPTEPRDVRVVEPSGSRGRFAPDRSGGSTHGSSFRARSDGDARGLRDARSPRDPTAPRDARELRDEPTVRGARGVRGARSAGDGALLRDSRGPREAAPVRQERGPREERGPRGRPVAWVPFHVSWGESQGADARRLLAVMCRRGEIRGTDVGSIRVSDSYSVVDIASHVADAFARAAGAPDPREPAVVIRREGERARAPMTAPPPPLPPHRDAHVDAATARPSPRTPPPVIRRERERPPVSPPPPSPRKPPVVVRREHRPAAEAAASPRKPTEKSANGARGAADRARKRAGGAGPLKRGPR